MYAEVIFEKQSLFDKEKGTECVVKKCKTIRPNYVQQKLPSMLSYQDRCCSSMAIFFSCSSSCPTLAIFRDKVLIKTLQSIANNGNNNNSVNVLTIC